MLRLLLVVAKVQAQPDYETLGSTSPGILTTSVSSYHSSAQTSVTPIVSEAESATSPSRGIASGAFYSALSSFLAQPGVASLTSALNSYTDANFKASISLELNSIVSNFIRTYESSGSTASTGSTGIQVTPVIKATVAQSTTSIAVYPTASASAGEVLSTSLSASSTSATSVLTSRFTTTVTATPVASSVTVSDLSILGGLLSILSHFNVTATGDLSTLASESATVSAVASAESAAASAVASAESATAPAVASAESATASAVASAESATASAVASAESATASAVVSAESELASDTGTALGQSSVSQLGSLWTMFTQPGQSTAPAPAVSSITQDALSVVSGILQDSSLLESIAATLGTNPTALSALATAVGAASAATLGTDIISGITAATAIPGATVAANIASDLTALNVASDIPGLNVASYITALNVASGIPGSNIASNIAGLNIASGIAGLNIASDIAGLNIASDIAGLNLASGIAGLNIASDIAGLNIASDIAGLNLASGIAGLNLASDIAGLNLASDIAGLNLASGIAGLNLATDIAGLATDIPGLNIADDLSGSGLADDLSGSGLVDGLGSGLADGLGSGLADGLGSGLADGLTGLDAIDAGVAVKSASRISTGDEFTTTIVQSVPIYVTVYDAGSISTSVYASYVTLPGQTSSVLDTSASSSTLSAVTSFPSDAALTAPPSESVSADSLAAEAALITDSSSTASLNSPDPFTDPRMLSLSSVYMTATDDAVRNSVLNGIQSVYDDVLNHTTATATSSELSSMERSSILPSGTATSESLVITRRQITEVGNSRASVSVNSFTSTALLTTASSANSTASDIASSENSEPAPLMVSTASAPSNNSFEDPPPLFADTASTQTVALILPLLCLSTLLLI